MKKQSIGAAAVFAGFLFSFLAAFCLTPDKAVSANENRRLAQRPSFSWSSLASGTFTQEVETWLSDQFPLRDSWISLKTGAEYALGMREFSGVYVCGDRLIAKVEEPDPEQAEKKLGYLQTLSEKAAVPVYAGWIPSAAEIWKDRLPDGAASFDQAAFCAQASTATDARPVDLLSALAAHGDEEIFYRQDHHWTTLGAYCGYRALMEAMGRTPRDAAAFTPRTVSESFRGTLYSTSGVRWLDPDAIQVWAPEDGITVTRYDGPEPSQGQVYDWSYVEKKDQYSLFLGGNAPLVILENPAAPAGTLLLVRDSYADSLAPFLAQDFRKVVLLDLRYYRSSVAEAAKTYEADAIAVLYSVPNFLTDPNLLFLAR